MKRAVAALMLGLWADAGWCVELDAHRFVTGSELLQDCGDGTHDDSPGPVGSGSCVGYIISAADTHNTLASWGHMPKLVCFPDEKDVSAGQLLQVSVKFLKGHPEELHKSASSLVLGALMGAFPCGTHR